MAFGLLEGFGVYLNGTGLADEVYASNDVNELIDRMLMAIDQDGRMLSH